MQNREFAIDLLSWYDGHARDLPWRIGPKARAAGQVQDPYLVWLSEIMLQQTTVVTVGNYYRKFTTRWPTLADLAAANDADIMAEWAGLGYYARARNLLKCARVLVEKYGGQFPASYAELLELPGVGPYTAAAISAIAFDLPEAVLDGNVKRVMARVFAVQETLERAVPLLFIHAKSLTPNERPGDYAQAIMDLGATVCTPKNPDCVACAVAKHCCARAVGIAAELPRRAVKTPKPTRYGIAYVARRDDGAWLLERRPEKGLLGGMLGWPTGEWGEEAREAAPLEGDWTSHNMLISHTFTHFHLKLSLQTLNAGQQSQPLTGDFLASDTFRREDLPTVMRKVYDAALPAFDRN